MIKRIITLIIFCCSVLILSHSATAGKTDRCHCFRDREYNPEKKFAADDYLLTTGFNSLIAATLGVSKREIVMRKMKGGVDPDGLLIALYIGGKTGSKPDILLAIHDNGGTWRDILNSPGIRGKAVTDPLFEVIRKDWEDGEIANFIADTLTAAHFHVSMDQVHDLHAYGFSSREICLIFALRNEKKVSVKKIVAMYQENKMSWSEIADSMQLTPAAVGKIILNK
jgi:hypothetical protein